MSAKTARYLAITNNLIDFYEEKRQKKKREKKEGKMSGARIDNCKNGGIIRLLPPSSLSVSLIL